MNNKNGFTLMELLGVIALISLVLILVVPNVISYLNKSTDSTMKIQEKELNDAALLYLEDYCKTPIGSSYVCPLSYRIQNDIAYYSGVISLNTLVSNNYIDEIVVRGNRCEGYINIHDNEATSYLSCGSIYTTEGYLE